MKKKTFLNVIILGIFLTSSLLLAGEKHDHDANVIKVDDNGKVALCACGHEVNVTESTAKVVEDGKTYYLCGEKCEAYFSKNASTVIPALQVKVMQAKAKAGTLGNVYKVDDSGAMIAKCGCGMDVNVTDKTVSREHEGHKYYLCSDGCAAVFDKNAESHSIGKR